jgi:hypothetical protein
MIIGKRHNSITGAYKGEACWSHDRQIGSTLYRIAWHHALQNPSGGIGIAVFRVITEPVFSTVLVHDIGRPFPKE